MALRKPVATVSKGTKVRTVRIEDGLWNEAKEVAAENGDNLSDVIRAALVEYIKTRETV